MADADCIAWMHTPFSEFYADMRVAVACRDGDEEALKSLGGNVAWVRVGDTMVTTVINLTTGEEREQLGVIKRIEPKPRGHGTPVLHTEATTDATKGGAR